MTDTKHGWVTPRADGVRARCGGPGVCATCDTEAMHEKMLTGVFGAPASASVAPGDAQDERQEWMTCESRRPWVTNSLKASAEKLRNKERRCRRAYTQDFYGVPARYVADVYAEAAAVFEAKLAALAAQVPHKGDAA